MPRTSTLSQIGVVVPLCIQRLCSVVRIVRRPLMSGNTFKLLMPLSAPSLSLVVCLNAQVTRAPLLPHHSQNYLFMAMPTELCSGNHV